MKARHITVSLLVCALAVLLIIEDIALLNGEHGDTISELVWDAVDGYPVIAFLIGLLWGSLLLAQRRLSKTISVTMNQE